MHPDISAIWVASNARTGSMWTTNIVRDLLRREGIEPLGHTVGGEEAIVAYGVEHLTQNKPGVVVLKTHKPVPDMPRSVGIVTRRDIRDATVSYMRFMRAPFDKALRFAERSLSRQPVDLFPGTRLVLDYTTINERPVDAVNEIAGFLGCSADAEAIAANYTRSAVAARIDAADDYVHAAASKGKPIERGRLVMAGPNNYRAADPETGFQTGHVSDYREGDWQRILSPEQQKQISALIDRAGHSMA